MPQLLGLWQMPRGRCDSRAICGVGASVKDGVTPPIEPGALGRAGSGGSGVCALQLAVGGVQRQAGQADGQAAQVVRYEAHGKVVDHDLREGDADAD